MTGDMRDAAALGETRGPPAQVSTVDLQVVSEVLPEDPSMWTPKSYSEWESRERVRTFLDAWSEQVRDERSLRRTCANWIFCVISFQVLAVVGLVIAQGIGRLQLDLGLLKVLLPSLLGDVFGLGFVVVKYLFSQPMRQNLDTLAAGVTAVESRTHDQPD